MDTKISFDAVLEQRYLYGGLVAWPFSTAHLPCQKFLRLCQRTQTEQGTIDYKHPSRISMTIHCCRYLQPKRYRISYSCWLLFLLSRSLIVVDYFSHYPEVIQLRSTTSQTVINSLKVKFARQGIPENLRTDNGPQFGSHGFAEFAMSYQFTHTTSSPHFPSSNG